MPEKELTQLEIELEELKLTRAAEKSRNTRYDPEIDDKVSDEDAFKEYAKKLAEYKSKIWKEPAEKIYGQIIGTLPSSYNYKRWYNMTTPYDLQLTLKGGDAHWMDSFGKTAWHPTTSIESPYNGYKNPYNPYGITFGKWYDKGDHDFYEVSDSQLITEDKNGNPVFDTDKTLNELGYSNDRVLRKLNHGENLQGEKMAYTNVFPTLYITPTKNYTKLVRNKTDTGWIEKEQQGGILKHYEGAVQWSPFLTKYGDNIYNKYKALLALGINEYPARMQAWLSEREVPGGFYANGVRKSDLDSYVNLIKNLILEKFILMLMILLIMNLI